MANPDAVKEYAECLFNAYEMTVENSYVLSKFSDMDRIAQNDIDRLAINLNGVAQNLRVLIVALVSHTLMEVE